MVCLHNVGTSTFPTKEETLATNSLENSAGSTFFSAQLQRTFEGIIYMLDIYATLSHKHLGSKNCHLEIMPVDFVAIFVDC